ncbi:oxidoreductase [Halococcus saccharolyticus DSM 5350]|uniref:Oxidoreductase n=1 Tax=Halococcus saccharolyticus DSM 5350 TaxID=1227455 RepID=M0MGG1_9EURY|nr:oxidoreductase [Halococcus saccharolyticus DSM 5350]
MNWRDVRVGIVGLGNIGREHADRLVEHDVSLVGGLDTNSGADDRFVERYGLRTYGQARELYDDVDAVVVATPNRHHEKYAVGALDAGLSVLLEKPLAHDLESAERIAEAARWSSGFCMVGFTNRYTGSVEAIKTLQRTGRFGDVRHIEANYIRRRGVPGIGTWFTDGDVAGGGSLIDIGVHAIDLALYILDFPDIVEVTGTTRSNFGIGDGAIETSVPNTGYEVDDSVTAFLRADDGTTVNLEVAWAATRPADDTVLVRGTDAGARFDRENDTLTLYENDTEGGKRFADTDVVSLQNDRLAAEQAAFLAAIACDEPAEQNPLEQALTVQRLIDAIYRSADAGRAIRLAEPNQARSATARRTIHREPETTANGWKQRSSSHPSSSQRKRNDNAQSPIPESSGRPDAETESDRVTT